MELAKKSLIVIVSLLLVAGMGVGLDRSMHSSLFTIQTVQVTQNSSSPPLDSQKIIDLSGVSVGKVGLFEINYSDIEHRLLKNDWIREVRLEKRYPHTLVIAVSFREPRALVEQKKGTLAFVDDGGKVFGRTDLTQALDIPILVGFYLQGKDKGSKSSKRIKGDKDQQQHRQEREDKVKEALRLIEGWKLSSLSEFSEISSVYWHPDRGFRVVASYELEQIKSASNAKSSAKARTMIDFGQQIDGKIENRLFLIQKVFRYLSSNSIAVRMFGQMLKKGSCKNFAWFLEFLDRAIFAYNALKIRG